MSRILEASCVDGKVTVEGLEIEATILSEGVGSSEGIVTGKQIGRAHV